MRLLNSWRSLLLALAHLKQRRDVSYLAASRGKAHKQYGIDRDPALKHDRVIQLSVAGTGAIQ
jgi:hypothetical protein